MNRLINFIQKHDVLSLCTGIIIAAVVVIPHIMK